MPTQSDSESIGARIRRDKKKNTHENNGHAGEAGPPARALRCRRMAEVQSQPTRWLWRDWIPLGALTILDGDPGLGKSTAAMDLAARVSRGGAMPPLSGKTDLDGPAAVLILNAEDSPEQTIRPRLDAASANTERVHLIEATRFDDEDERPPILPVDLDLLERLAIETGALLIVIDPFMAYLDGQLDAHRDQDVRRCLHRLKILAEKTGAAVLLVRHLNKLAGGPALYRGGGSIGISGAARSVLIVGRNPADPDQFILAPTKCNLCKMPQAITYSIETADNGVSVIGWGEETTLTADEILGHRRQGQTVAQECADMLEDLLADGPKPVNDVEEELKVNGYSKNAIRDARKILKLKAYREGGLGDEGRWMLSLSVTTEQREGEAPPEWHGPDEGAP